jgi:L-ornithine Nalpha-acyltransferase
MTSRDGSTGAGVQASVRSEMLSDLGMPEPPAPPMDQMPLARQVAQPSADPSILGVIGSLEVRLASTRREIERAQRLRYSVFYQEMSARPGLRNRLLRRDVDRYDAICEHLLVLDHNAPRDPATGELALVGTYRLLRQDVARAHARKPGQCGFYSAGEFQIDPLVAAHRHLTFLELGRSCVLKPYRTKRTVELLWHGVWSYVVKRKIDVLFGCASLDGTDPDALALPLSFLHHFASADATWNVRAVERRFESMDRIAKDAINQKQALRLLPPLIKGYLRLGAMIGDGAVIDRQFGTTDVLVLLPVEKISSRYISYYGQDAGRRAS